MFIRRVAPISRDGSSGSGGAAASVPQIIVEVIARVLQYIFKVLDVESGAVAEALKRAGFSTEESEGVMATTADKLRAEGKAEGKLEGKLEAARRMKEKGIDVQTISEITGLSLEELKKHQIID